MGLVKYNTRPSTSFPTSFGMLDRFFNDSVFDNTQVTHFSPDVDIAETDKAFELSFAVPGFDKNEFKIEIEENTLVVSGERKFEETKSEKNYTSVQTQYGSFKRSFKLPVAVKKDKVDASYNNGILEVVIPKDEQKALKSLIKVK